MSENHKECAGQAANLPTHGSSDARSLHDYIQTNANVSKPRSADECVMPHWLGKTTVSVGGRLTLQRERLGQLSWSKIKEAIKSPLSDIKTKERTPVIWFNNQGLRGEDEKEGGAPITSFTALWADIDTGNRDIDELVDIACGLGQFEFYVHTTASSCDDDKRYRLFIPLAKPCDGDEWEGAQKYLRWLLDGDACSIKPALGAFLPIATEGYDCRVVEGGPCSLSELLKRSSSDSSYLAYLDAIKADESKVTELADDCPLPSRPISGDGLIAEFNHQYTPQEVCEQAGYDFKRTNLARHPNSQSGSFSLGFKDGRCISQSTSDPLFHDWLSYYDPKTGVQRQQKLTDSFNSGDFATTEAMFSEYMQGSGSPQQQVDNHAMAANFGNETASQPSVAMLRAKHTELLNRKGRAENQGDFPRAERIKVQMDEIIKQMQAAM